MEQIAVLFAKILDYREVLAQSLRLTNFRIRLIKYHMHALIESKREKSKTLTNNNVSRRK